ncbi:MAG: hypothetical protein ABFS08_06270 [Pseudomonadota bacterium]
MIKIFRTLFSPILNIFESGDEPFNYRPSYRTILVVIAILFSALSGLVLWLVLGMELTYLLPVFVFGGVGFLGLLIGLIGTDRAVAKIWNSHK